MSLEAQCAAAEREAKRQSAPMFGLEGAAYDCEGGSDVVPGPLVWHQPDASYSSSLAGTGKPELLHVMKTMGEQASGPLALYVRTGGAHGAGNAKTAAPTQSPEKEKRKLLRVSFKCSQSVEAAKAKRGHGGVRKEKTLDAATGPPPRKRRKALLPVHECGAGFVVALRHKESRASRCTICGVMVRYSHAAPPDLLPHPAGKVNGACPWAATHSNNAGEHVVRSGFRVVHATTLHTNHWKRPQSLAARVSVDVAEQMSRMHHAKGVSSAAVAAVFAAETGGMLSSKQAHRVIHGGGNDAGLPGLLQHLEERGDVVYIVCWRPVLSHLVTENYGVAGNKSLAALYELHCPATAADSAATRWDITKLMERGFKDAASDWSAADFFRNGTPPLDQEGVARLTEWTTAPGYVLNASAVAWVSRRQSEEAARFPYVSITDTTCKSNNTIMEYGAWVCKDNRCESLVVGNYLLNGLTKANYRFAHQARRWMMGNVAAKTEYRVSDGDPHLQLAVSEDDVASRGPQGRRGGHGDSNAAAGQGLCGFHAVNIPARVLCAEVGANKEERLMTYDLKDKIHLMFRICETEPELVATHELLLRDLSEGTVQHGPTRRRAEARDAMGGATTARRTSSRTLKATKTKYEVERFLSSTNSNVRVKWVGFTDPTDEPMSAVLHDLGVVVFTAHCRAAGIVLDDNGAGDNTCLPPPGPATVAATVAATTAAANELEDEPSSVERFVSAGVDGTVRVKWVRSRQMTDEPPDALLHDLGVAQFSAFCTAAGITKDDLKYDYESKRDANVTMNSVLTTWYLDNIWPKRTQLALCFRRGRMHMSNWTSGAAESNFHVVKRGGDSGGINDKTSLRALGERLQHQETKRMANVDAARATEFGAVPHPALHPSVPGALLDTWTRAGLRLVAAQAVRAGLPAAASNDDDTQPQADSKYHVWNVQPQPGSQADAAWVVQRAAPRKDGGNHRIRVVHRVDGCMRCTCTTWESHDVECCHVLVIHGSVSVTSASTFWRRGTALGVNDDIHRAVRSPRPLGPAAQDVHVHSAVDRPGVPPAWRVRFWDRHVELVSGDHGAAPASLMPPLVTASSPNNASSHHMTQSAASGTECNHAIGQWCDGVFERVVVDVSSSGTSPDVAAKIKGLVAQLEVDVAALVATNARTSSSSRLGAETHTTVRQHRPGPGSSTRGKAAHETGGTPTAGTRR